MKKILLFVFGAMLMAACEDVPAPYEIHAEEEDTPTTSIYYTSKSLQSGWTLYAEEGYEQPWSQGSSYTQATGYQKWDGTTKSNKAAKGYLISPKFNTVAESGKVKFNFLNCLNYTSNDSDCENHYGIFISKDYKGDFKAATWEKLPYTVPTNARDTQNWATETSGDIALPSQYVNCDSVYIAFFFEAPESNSMTWELMEFTIQEGGVDRSAGVTYDFSTLGLANNTKMTGEQKVDDMTFTFAQGAGAKEPIYYNGVRLYAGNELTITAGEALSEVVINGESNYLGQGENMIVSAGTITQDLMTNTLTISGLTGNSVKIVNLDKNTNAGDTQLRFSSILVKFANP